MLGPGTGPRPGGSDTLVYIVPRLRMSEAVTPLPHTLLCRGKGRIYLLDSSWNVMAHGDARVGKWRGNWRMDWVASTLHTTSEHGVSSITTADAHTSTANSRMNWRPRRFKWTRPFRRKTKSGFCAYAITFQTQSTSVPTSPPQKKILER